jgi:Mg-chelatase subunit ChlD
MVAFFVVLLAVIFARRGTRRAKPDEQPASGEAVATAKYVPEKTEGLGASIAILIDNSGSMKDRASGDSRAKYLVAREALQQMLASTDSFVARQPDFPVNVGLYQFSSDVTMLVPVQPYNRASLQSALDGMPTPRGGTAIGDAMDQARADLYRAGTIRKYILVVTDGQNTDGRSPDRVAREINARSEGAVRMYFVAFDVEASRFDFVHDVKGEVLEARNGLGLRASLDSIYRGRILAESMNAGEPLADTLRPNDSGSSTTDSARSPSPPLRRRKPSQ